MQNTRRAATGFDSNWGASKLFDSNAIRKYALKINPLLADAAKQAAKGRKVVSLQPVTFGEAVTPIVAAVAPIGQLFVNLAGRAERPTVMKAQQSSSKALDPSLRFE